MPGFGRFETVDQLSSRGPVTVYSARPSGAEEEPTLVVKAYGGGAMMGGFDTSWDEHAAAFLESALLQKKLADDGCKRWAPIIAADRNEEAAYCVMKRYGLTAQELVEKPIPRDVAAIAGLVAGVVSGLMELSAKAEGRGHGNLKPSNVLIETSGGLQNASVFLTDPAAMSELQLHSDHDTLGQAGDLKDVGRLLFRLVVRREPPQAGAISATPEWDRVAGGNRKSATALRELCEQLLNPTAGPALTLEQVLERLKTLPTGGGGGKVGLMVGGGIAAAVAIGVGVWFATKKEKVEPNGNGSVVNGTTDLPPPPPPPPPMLDPAPLLAANWQEQEREDANDLVASIEDAAKSRKTVPVVLRDRLDAAKLELAAAVKKMEEAKAAVAWVPETKVTEAELAGQQAKLAAATEAAQGLVTVQATLGGIKEELLKIEVDVPPAMADQKLIDKAAAELAAAKASLAREIAAGGDAKSEFDRLDGLLADIVEVQKKLEACQTSTDKAEWRRAEEAREDFASPRAIGRFQRDIKDTTDRVAVAGDNMLKEFADKLEQGTDAAVRELPPPLRAALAGHLRKETREERTKADPEAGFTSLSRAEELIGIAEEWMKLPESMGDSVRIRDEARIPRAPFDEIKRNAVNAVIGAAGESLASAPTLNPPNDPTLAAQVAAAKQPLEARITAMQQLVDEAELLDAQLRAGLMYAEKAAGGKSIEELVGSIRGQAEFGAVGASVALILSDAELLASVDTTPLASLAATFPSEGGKEALGRLGAMRTAFTRLVAATEWPESLNDLDNAAKYAGVLKATAAENPERKVAIEGEADAGLKTIWVRFTNTSTGSNRELIAGAFDPARMGRLGVGEAETAKLKDASKFNRLWLAFEAKVGELRNLPAAEQEQKMSDAARGFLAELDGAGLTEAKLPQITDVRKALANARDKKGGADFAKSGPGAAGWSASTSDGDARFVSYSKTVGGALRTLGFVKVGDEAFLGTTEVSIGLAAGLLSEASIGGEELSKLLAGADRKDAGVFPWEIQEGRMRVRAPEATTGNGWFFPDQNNENVAVFAGAPAPAPTLQIPMTRLSPNAAVALASFMGCRLPTAEEWSAGATADDGATRNLRDGSYASLFRQLESQNVVDPRRRQNPAYKIFRTMDDPKLGDPADGSAAAGDDGVIFFAEVPSGAPAQVNARVGNVAEYVIDPTVASRLQAVASSSADAATKMTDSAAAIKNGNFGYFAKVIGGSALSLPAAATDQPRDIPANLAAGARNGYSDVGFRLAFTADGGGAAGGALALGFYNRQFGSANRYLDPK